MIGRFNITIAQILKQITEEQILYYYLKLVVSNKPINSPLREDKNPSFILNKYKNHIWFTDFGTNERGNLYSLLMKYFNINYPKLINKIYLDLDNIKQENINTESNKNIKSTHKTSKIKKSVSNIDVIAREWENFDIEYWEQYGISKDFLIKSNTYPISHIISSKNNKIYTINADKYAYVFVEYKDNIKSIKIYQPYSTKYKWINKHNTAVWDLWSKLPNTGKHLIITSSRKDALCIWENTGIPATNLQTEICMPKKHIINQLKKRFKNIYILYDNDYTKEINTGELNALKFVNKFNLIKLTLPQYLGVKDTSDLCKKYGRNKVKEIIYNLIKKTI